MFLQALILTLVPLISANLPLICRSFPEKHFECRIGNDFESLSAVQSTATKLTTIGGTFTVLQDKPFARFTQMKQLLLLENKIEKLSNTAFEGLSELTKLIIDGQVSEMEEDVFKPCPLLQELVLHDNKISQLAPLTIAISHLKNLELLRLSQNPIEVISNDDFTVLGNLSLASLDLSNCNLTVVEEGAFSPLKNLTIFYLPLNTLCAGNLSNALQDITPNLKYLWLTNSTLTEIPTRALEHISNIEIQKLSFSGHTFKTIEENSFPNMPKLLRLVISYGTLEFIEGEFLKNLPKLKELYLNNNLLSEFPINIPETTHLTRLVVSHNLIELNHSQSYFSSMSTLHELNLSFNKISHNPLAFEKKLTRLEKLYLEYNLIVPWHHPVIKNKLKELDLDSNKLDTVTPAMLQDFKVVDVLELHNNPFECTTCDMFEFVDWLTKSKHGDLRDGIMCAHPENTRVVKMVNPANCDV